MVDMFTDYLAEVVHTAAVVDHPSLASALAKGRSLPNTFENQDHPPFFTLPAALKVLVAEMRYFAYWSTPWHLDMIKLQGCDVAYCFSCSLFSIIPTRLHANVICFQILNTCL